MAVIHNTSATTANNETATMVTTTITDNYDIEKGKRDYVSYNDIITWKTRAACILHDNNISSVLRNTVIKFNF